MTPHTSYRSFHDHIQWSIFTVGLMGLELPWKHSEWVCEHVLKVYLGKKDPAWLGWQRNTWKVDTQKNWHWWLVQTLLEWCQLDNNSETQWVYHVQHKEAVSVGNSLRFWSCGKRLWLLGFALPVNILTQTRGRQCQGISMGLRP